jgi:hypothetical protein
MYEQEGAKTKNCEQVKSALTYWNAAGPNIHAGGSVSPPFAADALTTITKYTPAIESQIKVICK